MSVIPAERNRTDRRSKRLGFWRGLGRRLDALVAYPTRHAVSEQDLRRVDDEIERCRRLILKAR